MALSPILTLSISGDNLQISDDTVYGGGEYLRSQCQVNFTATLKQTTGDSAITLPAYDEDTVATILTPSPDGHVSVTMTITTPGGDLTDTESIMVTIALTLCRNDIRDSVYCKCCEDLDAQLLKFYKIDTALTIIGEYETDLDYVNAQCVVEGIQPLCDDETDCGC